MRSTLVFLSATAAAAAGVRGGAAAVPGGRIVGLFSNGATGSCDLWRISPSTGDNATVATSLRLCDGIQQFFPAVATKTADDGALVVAIGTGPSIFSISTADGSYTSLAPMPALNDSNWPLGLVSAGSKLYLVFQNDIMAVAGGKLTRLPIDISVPQYSQVTSCADCGSGGAAVIYVADEATPTIFTFDLGAPDGAPATITSGVKGDMDLQYSTGLASLIEVQSYTLYKTSPTTGKSTRIGYVPDGPGYPRVNALSPGDRGTIAIIDFSNLFTMDLTSGVVGPAFEFHLAPRVVGQPQWFSA